ncbi:hypothetical protein D3C73_1529940 [compost metagenome]
MNIKPLTCGIDLFAKQHGTAVTQHGEMTELMPRIGLGKGSRTFRNPVARKNRNALRGIQLPDIQSQRSGQGFIKNDQLR